VNIYGRAQALLQFGTARLSARFPIRDKFLWVP